MILLMHGPEGSAGRTSGPPFSWSFVHRSFPRRVRWHIQGRSPGSGSSASFSVFPGDPSDLSAAAPTSAQPILLKGASPLQWRDRSGFAPDSLLPLAWKQEHLVCFHVMILSSSYHPSGNDVHAHEGLHSFIFLARKRSFARETKKALIHVWIKASSYCFSVLSLVDQNLHLSIA